MRIVLLLLATYAANPGGLAAQRWVTVDVGFSHACALDDGGRAYCWGENSAGELGAATPKRCPEHPHGHGGDECAAGPSAAPIAVGGGHRFRAIRAGYAITCGVTVEEALYCWGIPFGLRSDGPGPFAPGRRFRGVEENERTVCGLREDGGATCFKHRGGWKEETMLEGTSVVSLDRTDFPLDIVCAVVAGGRARCRGENRYGQLGVAGEHEGFVDVAGGLSFAAVRTSETYTCALATGGEVYCWGEGGALPASLREGSPDPCDHRRCRRAPERVAGELRFRALDRGNEEMCGLTEAGEVYCWGSDGKAAPAADGTRFRAISGGYHQWCGITAAGALACWEWNKPGSLALVPPPAD